MDTDVKKTVLRMIPYGLYVLTAQVKDEKVAASTVTWVMQASFDPTLVAVGVKGVSFTNTVVKEAGAFALNLLGKGQQSLATNFFKQVEREGQKIGGEPFHSGKTGSPILENALGFLECTVVGALEKGDHTLYVGEVVDVGLSKQPEGRPDEASLWLRDLGGKIFYGG